METAIASTSGGDRRHQPVNELVLPAGRRDRVVVPEIPAGVQAAEGAAALGRLASRAATYRLPRDTLNAVSQVRESRVRVFSLVGQPRHGVLESSPTVLRARWVR